MDKYEKHTITDYERQRCSDCAFYHNGACTSWQGHNFKNSGEYCEYYKKKELESGGNRISE